MMISHASFKLLYTCKFCSYLQISVPHHPPIAVCPYFHREMSNRPDLVSPVYMHARFATRVDIIDTLADTLGWYVETNGSVRRFISHNYQRIGATLRGIKLLNKEKSLCFPINVRHRTLRKMAFS